MTQTPINSFNKKNIKILLLEGVHQNSVDHFAAHGYTNVELLPKSLSTAELIEKIKDVYFIGVRSRTKLTREVLSHAKKLVGIGCFCIGTNQVDLAAATELGIAVFNAPYENTRSVAELVVAEAVMLMRGVFAKSVAAHRGEWQKSPKNANEVRGKTFGIVGYGNIGTQVSVLCESFGMKVIYYDVLQKLPYGAAEKVQSLEELLKRSDIVSLHVPALPSTIDMIGERELAMMKSGSYLINAARGNVVVIPALKKYLENGHIIGAALDVFPVEPKSADEEFMSELRGMEQVIMTPHIGGNTQEAQENIGVHVADKMVKFSDLGDTSTSYNFPQVQLPAFTDRHRILHIHHNKPGILNKINTIFAERQINICAQYLQTNNQIGYVVFEIDPTADSKEMIEDLRNIDGTIKARILF